jgi:hypothetical protein
MKPQPVYTLSLWVFFGAFLMIGLGIFRFMNQEEKFVEPANIAEIVVGVCLFITAAIYRSKYMETDEDENETTDSVLPEEPVQESVTVAKPEIQEPITHTIETHNEIAVLLKSLQEKGRFIDFVMDDVTKYNDAQVGAAARVVHQGCKSVIKEFLTIDSIEKNQEQTKITLEAGFNASDYKLTGNIKGDAPFNGKLVHKGWKVNEVKLPKLLNNKSIKVGESFVITPAEVEI